MFPSSSSSNTYGASGGIGVGGLFGSSSILGKKPKVNPTTQFGNPATFTAAANTQASDYDKIMKQYSDLAQSDVTNPNATNPLTTSPVNFNPITPQTSRYEQSADVTKSLEDLKNLVDTGGYSDADIQNIRERDISPIRSIYANAQQNAERQKSLSGGYSPNFGAVTAQMSRDAADKIGDVTTKANADIAQNVASNKIAAASPYASASASANAAKAAADARNTDIINQINEYNSNLGTQVDEYNRNNELQVGEYNRNIGLENTRNRLAAIEGQRSLYGTNPALVNTFGNQVVQAGQLGQGQQDINNRRFGTIVGASR